MTRLLVAIAIMVVTVAFTATILDPARAQSTETRPCQDKKDHWSVCEGEDPKQCWAASSPQSEVNQRAGKVVSVRRSETYLFVVYDPAAGVSGHVSFTGGYPYANGSEAELTVGGRSWPMSTLGEWAWPPAGSDAEIVAAMKEGETAVVTGRSSRGTETKDTFSLIGFTAATDAAKANCM